MAIVYEEDVWRRNGQILSMSYSDPMYLSLQGIAVPVMPDLTLIYNAFINSLPESDWKSIRRSIKDLGDQLDSERRDVNGIPFRFVVPDISAGRVPGYRGGLAPHLLFVNPSYYQEGSLVYGTQEAGAAAYTTIKLADKLSIKRLGIPLLLQGIHPNLTRAEHQKFMIDSSLKGMENTRLESVVLLEPNRTF